MAIEFTSKQLHRRLLRAALLIVVCVWPAAPVHAHPAPFSYVDLRLNQGQGQQGQQGQQGRLEGSLTVHVIDLAHELNVEPAAKLLEPGLAESRRGDILNLLRSRLLLAVDGRQLDPELLSMELLPDRDAIALRLSFDAGAAPGLIKIQCALFPYDAQHQTFLNVYEAGTLTHQEIFDKDHTSFDYITGGRQGVWAAVKKFLLSGAWHIFIGPDHILFIVGLLLMGGKLTRLLAIVTAFTVAHSITLSLAALDVANPPSRLIEPIIALSIVYVGIDNLMVGKNGWDVRALIAFFFGLIHGFGFAGALREFGLPRQALGWSLFSFNLGVEMGQVCIVTVVASALAGLRKRNQAWGRRVAVAGSVVVIMAGTFWFIQRVFF